jgi:tRNA(Ile2) C34 agmatinyltransferase TiaS
MDLKLKTDHDIWEVWCEHTGETVYVDHRPTVEEIEEIRQKNWPGNDRWGMPFDIRIFKLKPFYTRVQPESSNPKCQYCGGAGWKSDDSYSSFTCPWCNGTGRR